MKKIFKTILFIIAAIFLALIACISVGILVSILTEATIAPKDYLFYEYGPFTSTLSIHIIVIPVILVLEAVCSRFNFIKLDNEFFNFWQRLKPWWKGTAVAIWIVAAYCCFVNVTFVTESTIVCHTPLNPLGTEYRYSEVEHIETGFGSKALAFCEYKEKGNFYYIITLDGKENVFHAPTVNGDIERYQEDSYLELEEFDKALVGLNIPKDANSEGIEKCNYDKEYVDRFLRIIKLK